MNFLEEHLAYNFKNFEKLEPGHKYDYKQTVLKYIKHIEKFKNYIVWIEIHTSKTDIDVFFVENTTGLTFMSNKQELSKHFNYPNIVDTTKRLAKYITKYPFFVIRTGWDQGEFTILDEPCVLRNCRKNKATDFGIIIPESYHQNLDHLFPLIEKFKTITFSEKQNLLAWRGVNSGKHKGIGSRSHFVELFHETHDVKFIQHPTMTRGNIIIPSNQIAPKLPIDTMAKKYKFQVALDGNTAASSLGWNLLSNSVVFITDVKDKYITFINPKQNIDYVAIKPNFEDLADKIQYYTEHADEAEKIASNGRNYIIQLIESYPTILDRTLDKIYSMYDQTTIVDAYDLLQKDFYLNGNQTRFTKMTFKMINNRYIAQ